MYLYFNGEGTLVGACSGASANFTVNGEVCSSGVSYDDYKDDHGYALTGGKIADLGEITFPELEESVIE